MTLTVDEIADRMKERESPDDILDILDPSVDELVDALPHLIERDYDLLNERYSDEEYYG